MYIDFSLLIICTKQIVPNAMLNTHINIHTIQYTSVIVWTLVFNC